MENKNVFEETVKTLTNDAMSLQQKFHKLQESGDIRASIDCLRLLKDTLSLIKEYDWHLEYSEKEDDIRKTISVWEQNHCGEIRNHKVWGIEKPTLYIDYGRDEVIVFVDTCRYTFNIPKQTDDFVDIIKYYSNHNYVIYVDKCGSGLHICDLLTQNGIAWKKISNI